MDFWTGISSGPMELLLSHVPIVAPIIAGILVLLVVGLVGFGEEFYFRGILRASMTRRHGETFAFVQTSLAFGLAHSAASLAHNVPLPVVAFQVGATTAAGAVLDSAYLATGRLWAPMPFTHSMTSRSALAAADSGSRLEQSSHHRP